MPRIDGEDDRRKAWVVDVSSEGQRSLPTSQRVARRRPFLLLMAVAWVTLFVVTGFLDFGTPFWRWVIVAVPPGLALAAILLPYYEPPKVAIPSPQALIAPGDTAQSPARAQDPHSAPSVASDIAPAIGSAIWLTIFVALALAGFWAKQHYGPIDELCNTVGGAIVQRGSSSSRTQCSIASALVPAAPVAQIIGGLGALVSIVRLVHNTTATLWRRR